MEENDKGVQNWENGTIRDCPQLGFVHLHIHSEYSKGIGNEFYCSYRSWRNVWGY